MKPFTSFMSLVLIALLGLTLGSCKLQRSLLVNKNPCLRDEVGTVCFQNNTRKRVKLNVGKLKTELRASTTICMDLYEGNYEYKAKQSGQKWENSFWLDRCDELDVCFSKS